MELEELVTGAKKVNLNELKELKVKLPVRLLVNLHYVKLTESRAISEVVNEALTQYFSGVQSLRANAGNGPADAAVAAALLAQARVFVTPSPAGATNPQIES